MLQLGGPADRRKPCHYGLLASAGCKANIARDLLTGKSSDDLGTHQWSVSGAR